MYSLKNKNLNDCFDLLSCFLGKEKVEIGDRLAANNWGQSLATEAAAAVQNYAFNKLCLNELIALIQAKNTASLEVAEKIGMNFARYDIFREMPVKVYRKCQED